MTDRPVILAENQAPRSLPEEHELAAREHRLGCAHRTVVDELDGILGPPVEPPDDLWDHALAQALDGDRGSAELLDLIPGPGAPEQHDAAADEEDDEPEWLDDIQRPEVDVSPDDYPDADAPAGWA